MEITGPPLTPLPPHQLQAAINTWKTGQVLQALVIKQTQPQTVILQVNNQQIQARSNVNLSAGQHLELTVIRTGERPILHARLLDTTTQQQSPVRIPDQTITSLLKHALPRQASISALLTNIGWITRQADQTVLPKPILDLARQLYQQIPDKTRISNPGQIKQNILNSGIFLENKLNKLASQNSTTAIQPKSVARDIPLATPGSTASTPANTELGKSTADLKLMLLRLFSSIQKINSRTPAQTPHATQATSTSAPPAIPPPATQAFILPTMRGQLPQPQPNTPPTLAGLINNPQLILQEFGKHVEAALARTQLHQAASLPANEQTTTSLAFELPIRNNEQVNIFDIIIDEDSEHSAENDSDNKAHWSVTIAFDLPDLGAVYAKLNLADEQISTRFWADKPETSQLFNQHLDELRQRYRQSGVEASEIHCYHGRPVDTASNLPHIVLDIKA